MIARAQLTVRDENDMQIAATAPANPAVDTLWLDTSVTPNMLKRWNGTAWVECGSEPAEQDLIIGTQTTSTAAWTGVASFAQLRDGQQIAYWLPYGSASNVTLTLTLQDGSVTEAIPCYYGNTTRLGTQYAAGNVLHLTYRENAQIFASTIAKGWWADANYNTDTYDRVRVGGSFKAKTAISANRLVVGDAEGCFHLAAGAPFDVSRSILYAYSASAAGAYSTNYYLSYPYCYLRSMIADFTGTVNATCYLVGTLAGSAFTPADAFLTSEIPTSEDGYTYIALGTLTSAYQICLFPEHPMYRYVDGAFKALGQVAYDTAIRLNETRTEMSTRFEQTDAALILKADSTTVSALGERVSAAEQKVTPEAIASTVTSAALYAYEKYPGRNYCLNSAAVHTFVDNRYQNANGTMSTLTYRNLSVSDDLFAHSENGACIRISFDIKRTNVDASAASTANVYSGFWVYYRYYGADGTTVYITGRGWYLYTTAANFAATDDDWVRMTSGPLNLSSFNPISIAYFSLGTGAANGTTGTVQYRNVKLEVLDEWTDWSAAPEDVYGLADRMTNAETNITQNASNIALRVYTSTYNMEKVYRSATEPTTKYTNMFWLDMSLTPNILKRWTGSEWTAVGAQEVKASGISIGSNNVAITTENFLLQLLDPNNNENVLMEMSANGNVGFKELYADEIISDSVPLAYHGPAVLYVITSYSGQSDTYFRSLGDAVTALNNKYLPYNVTIYLPSASGTVYESSGVEISGITGPGKLTIYGYSSCVLSSHITVKGCSAHILFQNVSLREIRPLVNGSGRNGYLVECQMNHFVELNGCTLDANGTTYDSIYVRSSHVVLIGCGLYNALQGMEVYQGTGVIKNCSGSCSWAMVAYGGLIFASGTVPGGSRSSGENGQVFASGVTINYGTAIAPVVPDETTIQYATLTKSWRGSWRSDTLDVIQGVYSDSGYSSSLNWNRGCMWFGNLRGVLSGATINSAKLTLHRKTGSGSGSAKTVYLCAITNTGASGTPNIAVNYGALGTIGRNATVTFSIPIAAVQGLANGTYGGLCLYESPYNFGSSTYSNCYMRMSGTDESSYTPYLTVVYNSSGAVG